MGFTQSTYSQDYQVFKSNYHREVEESDEVLGGYKMFTHKYQSDNFIIEKIRHFQSLDEMDQFITINNTLKQI